MKRTRKWTFVAQEARRLAELGLSGYAIAKQLEVEESTVSRWVKAGKLVLKTGERATEQASVLVQSERQTPDQWAATVRESYLLDPTDDQLVTMGQAALAVMQNPEERIEQRLRASREFRAIVKQLNLVLKTAQGAATAPAAQEPERKPKLRVVRRSSVDPRRALMAVSE